MSVYKESQVVWLVFFILVPIQVVTVVLYFSDLGTVALSTRSVIIIQFISIAIYLLFYSMTVIIDDKLITIKFGLGLIQKTIPIKGIRDVSLVTNRWYHGWGIRLIGSGTLYNAHGFKAVELTFYNTPRVVRIGCKNCSSLKGEIVTRLG